MMVAIKTVLFLNLLAVAIFSMSVTAKRVDDNLLNNLHTFSGKPIAVDKEKITHFVFIDLWRSYEGKGDEKVIAALPDTFLQQSQQLWLQPEVNVTKAQLVEFQKYFPNISPLILDQQFSLMRNFKVWQSPFHVLVQDNEQIFSGDDEALLTFIAKKYSITENHLNLVNKATVEAEEGNNNLQVVNTVSEGDFLTNTGKPAKPAKPAKPVAGDMAPEFSSETLNGDGITLADALLNLKNKKPLNLVFIDALCPMPHFPDCEEKLAKVNELVAKDNSRQWLGVVNSYYVNKEYVQQFVKDFTLKFPLVFDQDNTIYRAYDVYASPYLIKINQQGVIESRGDELH